MDGRGSSVSISDSIGNLQFYAYSNMSYALTTIYDATHDTMLNSQLIQGDGTYNELVIIPKPNSPNLYFLFNKGAVGFIDTLYYSLIDMNLNGGLGQVVEKNRSIDAYRVADCVTAVKHGNGRDWWLITKLASNPMTTFNRFYVYLITPDSIYSPIIQDFNNAKDVDLQKIAWHPSYDKFMLVNLRGLMAEYNFDRCNGSITLDRIIFNEQVGARAFWDASYSPNGNLFYVDITAINSGDQNYLLQYDLTAGNIPASCDTLDSTLYPQASAGALRLAPDGKIYYSQCYIPIGIGINYPYADSMRSYINENLGVINNPDVMGNGCNFTPFSFYLGGKRTYWGLPNNPDYSLGPLTGSSCDTLDVSTNDLTDNEILIFPNPVVNRCRVKYIFGNIKSLAVYNLLGEKVYEKINQANNVEIDLNLILLDRGLYNMQIQTNNGMISKNLIRLD